MIPLASGFCYVNNRGDVCPIANIDLFSLTSKDMETAERYLDEAATKLKSILVCKQVTENVRSGIKALQTLGPGKLGKVKKATIRLVSTHGLEHFVASVPLRYKPDVDDQEDLEKQLAAVFRVWPFNVCINISTWISPTNLRRLTASGNLVPFGRWCLSYPIMLQNIDIPEDAKDKGFSMFGETSIWTAFYAGTNSSFLLPYLAYR
jgi:hypothetical protein